MSVKILTLVALALFLPSVHAKPIDLNLTVKTFALKKGEKPPKIKARFWPSKTSPSEKAFLIASPFKEKKYKKLLESLTKNIQKQGLPILWIDPREQKNSIISTSLEDIQTGVFFLRTDSRVKKVISPRLTVVAAGASALGAAKYGSANNQVIGLVEKIVLLDADEKTDELITTCRPVCESVKFLKPLTVEQQMVELHKHVLNKNNE